MKKNILYIFLFVSTFSFGQNLTNGEYYIDNDLGTGKGTVFSVSTTANADEDLTISIDENLPTGLHRLFVRVQNSFKVWSPAKLTYFYHINASDFTTDKQESQSKIKAYEYFIDTPLEPGNGIRETVDSAVITNQAISITLPTDLEAGLHCIFVRVKNDLDVWSQTKETLFYVLGDFTTTSIANNSPIVDAEYFIDDFVDVGQATAITINQSGTDINNSFQVDTQDLSLGNHTLFVRVKNEQGLWSVLNTVAFEVTEALTVKSIEIPNVSVYPNPSTNGDINISFGNNSFTGKYQLYNVIGKLLKSKNINNVTVIKESITTATGIYFIKLLDNNKKVKFLKIIKE